MSTSLSRAFLALVADSALLGGAIAADAASGPDADGWITFNYYLMTFEELALSEQPHGGQGGFDFGAGALPGEPQPIGGEDDDGEDDDGEDDDGEDDDGDDDDGGGCPDCPDFNGDGFVGQSDLGILLADFGGPPSNPCVDANGNGVVDQSDLGVLLAHFGSECDEDDDDDDDEEDDDEEDDGD